MTSSPEHKNAERVMNVRDDELRFAPHGASAAACAVCGWESMKRVVDGDGFVPPCSR